MTTTDTRAHLAWRVTAVLAATVAIWGLMAWGSATFFDSLSVTTRVVNAVLVCGLAVPMVVAARRHLDRRPWAGLAVQGPAQAWRPFLAGVAAFLLPSALGLTLAALAGWLQLSLMVPLGEVLAWAALLVPLVLLSEAVPEELIFRGYLYRNLVAAMAPWQAVLVQAVLFTLFGTGLWVATQGWGVLGERGLMFLGMAFVLGLLRLVTASVWTCIGFHLAFQVVAQTLLSARVQVGNEVVLTLAGIVSAFALAPTIAGWFAPREPSWTQPQPDLAPAEAERPREAGRR